MHYSTPRAPFSAAVDVDGEHLPATPPRYFPITDADVLDVQAILGGGLDGGNVIALGDDGLTVDTARGLGHHLLDLAEAADGVFTETSPRDDGPDYPATPMRVFSSVPGHAEGLEVQALLDEDGPLFHVGDAVLDRAGVSDLVDHLQGLLDVLPG